LTWLLPCCHSDLSVFGFLTVFCEFWSFQMWLTGTNLNIPVFERIEMWMCHFLK
jgi:hypothetical protein